MTARRPVAYLTPAIWLMVPVMAVNIGFAALLPAAFQPEIFWAGIPAWIAWPENTLRILMFAVCAVLPLRRRGAAAGWVVYLAGLACYGAAWGALILAPQSTWAMGAAGFLAPAYTPILWLIGVGLIADRPVFSQAPRRRWIGLYAALCAGFLVAHVAHAALVYSRLP